MEDSTHSACLWQCNVYEVCSVLASPPKLIGSSIWVQRTVRCSNMTKHSVLYTQLQRSPIPDITVGLSRSAACDCFGRIAVCGPHYVRQRPWHVLCDARFMACFPTRRDQQETICQQSATCTLKTPQSDSTKKSATDRRNQHHHHLGK